MRGCGANISDRKKLLTEWKLYGCKCSPFPATLTIYVNLYRM